MIKTVLRQQENNIYLNRKEGLKSMKKILSAILVAAMLLSTMGMVTFAAGNEIPVANATQLEEAMKNAVNGDTIKLAAGVYDSFPNGKTGVRIVADGEVTVNDSPSFGCSDFYVEGINFIYPNSGGYISGSGTFKNCTFKGKNGFRSCYAKGTVTFENCKVVGVTYGIHFDGNDGIVNIINCELTGFNAFAYSLESLNITGTKFYADDYSAYKHVNFWGNTNIDNCIFEEGFTADSCADDIVINVTNSQGTSVFGEDEDGAIVIDGVCLTRDAKIGDTYYDSLHDALALAGAANAGNTTIDILRDIDLGGAAWTPVQIDGYHGADIITINGNNHTIKGLSAPLFYSGFAGGCGLKVNNLTIADSEIIGTNPEGSGAFIEYADSMNVVALENCNLLNSSITGTRTGGLIGWTAGYNNQNDGPVKSNIIVKNCSVIGCEITGSSSAGAVIGHSGANAWTFTTIEDCTVKNNTIHSTDEGSWRVGVIVGTNNVGETDVKNVTAENNTVTQAGKEMPEGQTALVGRNAIGNTGKLWIDGIPFDSTAKHYPIAIGKEGYITLAAAVDAAKDGDTIKLIDNVTVSDALEINKKVTIDLDGHTLNMTAEPVHNWGSDLRSAAYYITKDVTFANGAVVVSNSTEKAKHGNFFVEVGKSLTFDNVELTSGGINAFALIQAYGPVNYVNKTTVTLEGAGRFMYSEESASTVTVNDSEITLTGTDGGLGHGLALDADKAVITMKNINGNGLRNVSASISDSVLYINGSDSGIKNDGAQAVTIDGTSVVTITGAKEYDLNLGASSTVTVEDGATLRFGTSNKNENVSGNGNVLNNADAIYVQFEKKDIDAQGKDNEREKDVYDIILTSVVKETINELASADLTFSFAPDAVGDGDMSYAITSKAGVTLSQTGKATEKDRFMFNYSGVDDFHQESGNKIVLGQVTINGYGKYTFGVNNTAAVTTNAVYATEIENSIVDGFTPAADLILNEDMDTADTLVGEIKAEITVPVQKLTINVTFPNAVTTDNKELYQDMQVKIEGGNVKKTIALGNERTEVEGATVTVGDGFVVEIDLPYNTTYTVTVSGAGYRTATYSVVLTGDKELTFWNNVMDDDKEIEKNNANSVTKKNFLAGDIVKDNKINIYDLSAVVSYFGKIDLDSAPDGEDFAKYDLDRDGKIDAKDVAYVLVSWGN